MGFYLVMPPVMDAKRGIAFLWAFLSRSACRGTTEPWCRLGCLQEWLRSGCRCRPRCRKSRSSSFRSPRSRCSPMPRGPRCSRTSRRKHSSLSFRLRRWFGAHNSGEVRICWRPRRASWCRSLRASCSLCRRWVRLHLSQIWFQIETGSVLEMH